jgi:hypothetical protein
MRVSGSRLQASRRAVRLARPGEPAAGPQNSAAGEPLPPWPETTPLRLRREIALKGYTPPHFGAGNMRGFDADTNYWTYDNRSKTCMNLSTGRMCVGEGYGRMQLKLPRRPRWRALPNGPPEP